ncbi:MAG: hypothetical protein MJZ64_03450 [Paludibacteraceae bacterium]|nr:hypothetical protein [Paludibacteraceae bacterium]
MLLAGVLAAATVAHAQVSSYLCGFEDESENVQWHLNEPKNEEAEWPNLWVIGTADKSEGEHSLYISNDGGATTNYSGDLSRIMIAWRTLTLEAGMYDFAIDWKAMGGNLAKSNLRVVWIAENDVDDKFLCGLNSEIESRAWIMDNTLTWDAGFMLGESSIWRHSLVSLKSDGKPHRLVLVWLNDNTAPIKAPGACVDNIQICRNDCGKPTNLQSITLGQIAQLSWSSSAEEFNLLLRRIDNREEYAMSGIKAKSVMMQLPAGAYEPFMQVICKGDTSVWYSFPVLFSYTAVGFNYLSLTNDRCFYAEDTPSDWHDVDLPGVLKPGRIDKGFLSVESRHTIHYYPDELDARTYNSIDVYGNPAPPLHTVPEGEIASVRIGSWEELARVARIVYDFTVDSTTTGTLMIKYALVLQMSGHEEAARPRFTLKIVDAVTGEEINPCTTVDFSAKTNAEGWYNVPVDGDITSDRTVCWRDWTTVGLNLNQVHGRKVRVILTALGCTAEIHYGYAYFTASCSTGQIQGIQCGDTPTEQFIAPDGFNYRWYLKSNPNNTLSTERIYDVDYRDDREYGVDVIYKTDDKCGFTLSACAIPRYPIPDVDYKVIRKDCKNYIWFINRSHIRTRNLRTGEIIETNIKPEAVLWDFQGLLPDSVSQDSIPWNPLLELPSEEADYHFTLKAIVGLCDSTQHFYIHVPKAAPDSIVEEVQWCEGHKYVDSMGRTFLKDTTVIDRGYKNMAGCDSVHTLCLRFVKAIRDTTKAEIAEGETYEWQGRVYTTSVLDSLPALPAASGCDSINYLLLKVNEHLAMEVTSFNTLCNENDTLYIYIHARAGEPNAYKLFFDEHAKSVGWKDQSDTLLGTTEYIAVPMNGTIPAGWYAYQLQFKSAKNGDCTVYAEAMVPYSNTLIQQRWDDVLGIQNENYNGGHVFTAFQWYKDGQPILGAVNPYWFEQNGLTKSEYSVMLIQEGESKGVMTCPFIPDTVRQDESAAQRKYMINGALYLNINNRIYNAQGQSVQL